MRCSAVVSETEAESHVVVGCARHGQSQLMTTLAPRAEPAARGKSFNQGFVYRRSKLVAAGRT